MATTLPTLTRTIDDDFLSTWYEIRPQAIDNILQATVMWLALKSHGCLTEQVGGEYITRTIRYGTKSTQNIKKGSILTQSEGNYETMARWDWKYFAIDVNRTLIDDQKNQGKFRIKSYIATRLEVARDSCVQDLETKLFQYGNYTQFPDGTSGQFNGLFDIICPATAGSGMGDSSLYLTGGAANYDAYNSGTANGNINRTNDWWRNNIKSGTAPSTLNLVSDMRTFYNTIGANVAPPNFIICDQDLYQYYEDEVSDKQQIVRTSFNQQAADLGFETLTFKGASLSWSSKLAGSSMMLFMNLDFIEVVYDPTMWFEMTDWKENTNQLERVAYIVCALQMIDSQPRRHGLLYY